MSEFTCIICEWPIPADQMDTDERICSDCLDKLDEETLNDHPKDRSNHVPESH